MEKRVDVTRYRSQRTKRRSKKTERTRKAMMSSDDEGKDKSEVSVQFESTGREEEETHNPSSTGWVR